MIKMKKIIMTVAAIAIVGISVAAITNKATAPDDDFIGPRQQCKDLLVATDTDENGNVEVYIDNEYCSWYN